MAPMELPPTLFDDLSAPERVVVVASPDVRSGWVLPAGLGEAPRVEVRAPDAGEDDAARAADEVAALGVPLQVVVHEAGSASSATVRRLLEALVGRMEPDGLYLVVGTPERSLALELALVAVSSPALVRSVGASRELLALRRGDAPPQARPLDLDALFTDPFEVAHG